MKPDDITDEEWNACVESGPFVRDSLVAQNALRDERVRVDERLRVVAILRETKRDFAGAHVNADVVLAAIDRRLREGWTP